MIGMTREQVEQAVDDWYANNQDKVASFIQDFSNQNDCGDDMIELVGKVMASVGSTVALSAVKDLLVQNNELINAQINEIIDAKIGEAFKK